MVMLGAQAILGKYSTTKQHPKSYKSIFYNYKAKHSKSWYYAPRDGLYKSYSNLQTDNQFSTREWWHFKNLYPVDLAEAELE